MNTKKNDVCVIPTITAEGFPRVIDEAMAFGMTIICTKIGGMKVSLANDEVIFVEPNNTNQIYEALNSIHNDSRILSRYSKKSHARALKIYYTPAYKQHARFLLNI